MSLKGYAESLLSIAAKNALAIAAVCFAFVDDWSMAVGAIIGAFYVNQSRMLWMLELAQFERDFNKE